MKKDMKTCRLRLNRHMHMGCAAEFVQSASSGMSRRFIAAARRSKYASGGHRRRALRYQWVFDGWNAELQMTRRARMLSGRGKPYHDSSAFAIAPNDAEKSTPTDAAWPDDDSRDQGTYMGSAARVENRPPSAVGRHADEAGDT